MMKLPLSKQYKQWMRMSVARYSSNVQFNIPPMLEEAIEDTAISTRQRLLSLRQRYSDVKFEAVAIKTTLGGMRGTKLLLCETSQVDPHHGISYRGHLIEDVMKKLPSSNETRSLESTKFPPIPKVESLLWLLLTGKIPNDREAQDIQNELFRRMRLPAHVTATLDALPINTHPMTQFVVGVAASQTDSIFSSMYKSGQLKKADYWKASLCDGLTLIAQVPLIAGHIYKRSFRDENSSKKSKELPTPDPSLDLAGNTAKLLGFDSAEMRDVMRLYMFLHADHEGGNVSAHTAHLVGSALSDNFLSFAASMAGLAANQECLRFLRRMEQQFKEKNQNVNAENVSEYIENTLKEGKVIPGFGHAVLRVTDPRFSIQRQFALATIKNDTLNDLLGVCLEVVPKILQATGKASNPWPNVDAHSGVILNYFGIKEDEFFTVLFGLSRCIGVVSQLVWDRIFNLPLERPKSIPLDDLEAIAKKCCDGSCVL